MRFRAALALAAWLAPAWAQTELFQGTLQRHVIKETHDKATCPGPSYGTQSRTVAPATASAAFPSDFGCPVMQFNGGNFVFAHPGLNLKGTTPAGNLNPQSIAITDPAPAPALSGRVSGTMVDTQGGDTHRFRLGVQITGAVGTCSPPSQFVTNSSNSPTSFNMQAEARCAAQSLAVIASSVKTAAGKITEFEAEAVTTAIAEMAHTAPFGSGAWSGGQYTIEVRSVYKFTAPLDSVRITQTTPDGTITPLKSEQRQGIAARVECRLDSSERGRIQLEVIEEGPGGGRLRLDRIESAEFTKGPQTVTMNVPAFDIPRHGKVILRATLVESPVAAPPKTLATAPEVALNIADDYSIEHIEVVQVTQDASNSVPLVAGKAFFVRVFATRAARQGPPEEVAVTVFAGRPGGAETSRSDDGFNRIIKKQPVRTPFDDSHDVTFGKEIATEGDVRIRVLINPARATPEYDYTNNERTITVRFQRTRGLVVKYLPVCIQIPGLVLQCPTAGIANTGETLERMYPMATGSLSYSRLDAPDLIWPEVPDTDAKRDALFRHIERMFDQMVAASGGLIEIDQIAAWLPSGLLGSYAGIAAPLWSQGKGRVTLNTDTSGDDLLWTQNLLAHEVGHNLGLRHTVTRECQAGSRNRARDPKSDWPFPLDASIREHGADPIAVTGRIGMPLSSNRISFDLMSYCGPAEAIWMSPFHYRQLYDGQFLPGANPGKPAAAQPADADYSLVSGQVSRDGAIGQLDPLLTFNGAAPLSAADPAGGYCLAYLDATGQTLGQHCFGLDFQSAETGRESETQIFSRFVSLPASTARISLRAQGRELASRVASASAPSVRFDAPAAGAQWQGGQEQTIRWTGSDADGGALTYSLFYSTSDRDGWIPLAVNLEAAQFAVDPARIRSGPNLRLRVVVSDGFHTAEATVGPLTVTQSPSIAVAGQPVNIGDAYVGSSAEGVLAARNTGSGPLTIQSITSSSPRFQILSPGTPLLVAAGESRDVLVRFTADALGEQSGTITFASNAVNQAQLAVTVQGTGVNRQAPRIALGARSLFFGREEAGSTTSGALEIRNPNLPDLNVTWQASGAAFQVSGQPASFTLKSGESRVLSVAFSPQAAGTYQGTLTVRSNDTRRAEIAVGLGGFAFAAQPDASPPVFTAASLKSAASYAPGRLAEQMWVALEGQNLAGELIIPSDGYPTSLGGTRVLVTDSAGAERAAQLHFVSPDRLNFLMPAGTALGDARVTVVNGQGERGSATARIERVAPGLFTARSDGQGPAAATYLRVAANGTRTEGYTFTLDAARNNVPLPLGPEGEQVYLSLFGTGFRAQSSAAATVAGLEVPLLGAVAHPQFAGLDQAVIGPLPRALAGRGEVTIELTFDGVKANPVTVSVE